MTARAIVYAVAADDVPGVERHVRDVVSALAAAGTPLRYVATNIQGTGTFVHVVDAADAPGVLEALPQFRAFQEFLRPRLVAGPQAHAVRVVGAVGLPDGDPARPAPPPA